MIIPDIHKPYGPRVSSYIRIIRTIIIASSFHVLTTSFELKVKVFRQHVCVWGADLSTNLLRSRDIVVARTFNAVARP